MRLRIFDAPTMQLALARMRETLGPDAAIVASQETAEGVRLTAALDAPRPAVDEILRPHIEDGAAERLAAILRQHGVPTPLLTRLAAVPAGSGDDQGRLAQSLRRRLPFAAPLGQDEKPVLLTGMPGAGKTTLAARLAASSLLLGREVTVVAADRDRSGGIAQLTALLAPMGIEPRPVQAAADLVRLLREPEPGVQTIIDLPAIDPFRGEDLARLGDLAQVAGAPPVVVMPAGLDPLEVAEMAENLAAIGCRRMVVTRLDLARRLGSVLAAAAAGLAIANATASPLIGKGLLPMDPLGLARLLLAQAAADPATAHSAPGEVP